MTPQDFISIWEKMGFNRKARLVSQPGSKDVYIEGCGCISVDEAIHFLKTQVPRYEKNEISGHTYRIALDHLLSQFVS